MKNIQYTLMSQYANSPIIVSLIEQINDVVDSSQLIDQFYRDIFNVATAKGYGLDVWGRIVGIGRKVPLDDPNAQVFGFHTDEPSPLFTPFNVAPFRSDSSGFSSYSLPDELYRKLIMAKALVNIISATAPSINKLLKILIETPSAYLLTDVMKAKYQFRGRLSNFDRMVVFSLDLLPKPCGVEIEYEELI